MKWKSCYNDFIISFFYFFFAIYNFVGGFHSFCRYLQNWSEIFGDIARYYLYKIKVSMRKKDENISFASDHVTRSQSV